MTPEKQAGMKLNGLKIEGLNQEALDGLTAAYDRLKELRDQVSELHRPHLLGERLLCVGCTNVQDGYLVDFPCRTARILLGGQE